MVNIFADFNNADRLGRVRLNTVGTFEDLKKTKTILEENLKIIINDGEEFEADAIVKFSNDENIWVAVIDWDKVG